MSLCVGLEELIGLQQFFHQLNLCWFLQPEVVGIYLPGTGTLGWGAWYVSGAPCSQDIPPEFLFTTNGLGPACSASVPLL